ncbi:efflux RND transporter permease subunit [Acuticoccus mangrovi]|uniref:Efflux RND transporter permease subunit n=1 Tax=Acuticoccus mangrovi TaxID=2796142 RepID=A0A934INE2_9HYPH|nr:efflux RND transporter permease subunit [Acuticoccus mangrovi]MBJ3775656.1 efflux RND transporter permease subunit [Acuticoccus mangrovi]
MRWNISAWAIRNPMPSALLFIVLTGLGLISFRALPITYFPTIDVPEVKITIEDAGVAPSQMETDVTKPVEDAVATLTGVKEMKSSVVEGESQTSVEFELGVPIDRAVADVKDAIARISSDLPASADEPVTERVEAGAQAVVSYAIANAAMTPTALSWFIDDTVIRELQGIAGIGQIERVGGAEREVQIRLDPDRLFAYAITAVEVTDQLRQTHVDVPAGRSTADGRERAITAIGTTTTLADLAAIPIALDGLPPLTLGDLGTVADASAEPTDFALLDGAEGVSISVYPARGASDVTVAAEVARVLTEIAAAHPGLVFERVDNSVDFTLGNYDAALHTLLEGAVLTVVVVFFFLRDWRATLIAAIALPLAAIPTFWVIDALGFSLNMLSLLAITLVTGILVDDAIVEIENIVRHAQMGKTPYDAAMDASDEIGLAVVAISATIIAVFVPVGLMGGEIGQYFRQFGLTVAIAVFFSLLVARLATPVFAAYLMRSHPIETAGPSRLQRAYVRFVALAVRRRWIVIPTALGVFAVSLSLATTIPTEFLPSEDTGRLAVSIELPPGSPLAETKRVGEDISARLADVPEVRTVYIQGGTDATGARGSQRMAVILDVGPAGERVRTMAEITADVAAILLAVPDIRFETINDRGKRDVSFSVLGRDGAAVEDTADRILAALSGSDVAVNPTAGALLERPVITIRVDPERAADAGVAASAVGETVRVSTVGASDSDLPGFVDDARRVPIRVQLEERARDDLATIGDLRIPANDGSTVPLSQVADIEFSMDVGTIERMDRNRRIDIGFDVPPGLTAGQGLDAVYALEAVRTLPTGVRVQATGDSDNEGEVFAAFGTAMAAGSTLVMIVLILLFGGPLTPITILATLPLSVAGVVAALFITEIAVSLPVVIGILMLMGIVTKNAIMLVDFAIEREAGGLPRHQAVVEAASERVRPILMTTLAMIAGMLPAAIGTGEGGGFRAPMAITVIGGLLVSTGLSLVVVPALHTVMADFGAACTAWFRRFLVDAAAEPGGDEAEVPEG